MQKRTIIFDFDGTIADTIPAMLKVAHELATENNWKMIDEEELKLIKDKTPQEVIKYLNIPMYKIPFLIGRGHELLLKYMKETDYITGMKEALGRLREREYFLGVVSSNSRTNIDAFIEKHGMNFFSFIFCEKNVFGKGHTLDKVIKKMGFNKEECIYVGDEVRDIEACKKINLDIISVTWGFSTKRVLQSYSPEHIIDSPEELLSLLP